MNNDVNKLICIATPLRDLETPKEGWVRAYRRKLSMTGRHLAERLGLSKQRVAYIERQELESSLTLKTMQQVAGAMDAEFVYAIVPKTSIEETLDVQAEKHLYKRFNQVSHSMDLEGQGLSAENKANLLKEAKAEYLSKSPKKIWDS